MKIIAELSEKIEDEIDCAETYIRCALNHKEDWPQVAETFYKIANSHMNNINLLHEQVTSIINDYKKNNGEPPEAMKILYDILHKKFINHFTALKGMMTLFKEA